MSETAAPALAPSPDPVLASHRWTYLLVALLALLTAATYARTLTATFVDIDDNLYVFENPHVMSGLTPGNIKWAFVQRTGGLWTPLTWLSLQFDATLTPPVVPVSSPQPPLPSAAIFHFSNVLYHTVGTCFLFLFLHRATRLALPSFFAALLWAVHPLRVESVAWVTERKDVLCGLFGFLSLYLYVLWTQTRGSVLYAAMVAAAALSLLAKPMTLTLPAIMLLIDFWPLRRSAGNWGRRILEKLPVAVIAAIIAVLTIQGQKRIDGLPIGRGESFLNAIASYGRYLWMNVDFRDLAVFYPYRPPSMGLLLLSATAVLAITVLAIVQRRSRPALLVGWLWFLGTFVPMIGLVNPGAQAYADRYTYLPAVGIAILLVFSLPESFWTRPRQILTVCIAAVTACVLIGATLILQSYWRNTTALFERALAVTPENPLALQGLAMGYIREARYDDAIRTYERIKDPPAQMTPPEAGIAMVHLVQGHTREALTFYRQALEKNDRFVEIRYAYAMTLAKDGQWNAAGEQLEQVLAQSPDYPNAREALAQVQRMRGR